MKMTVLGCYGPYPAPGGACSGYLLEHDSYPILLECGNGVLSRLQYYFKPWELKAVVASHLHSDHVSDLLIMRYALDIAQNHGVTKESLDVFAPDEPAEERERIFFKDAYRLHTIEENSELELGPYRFSFLPVKHPLPTLAMKIECGGKTLVYSGDTEYMPGLVDFAEGADLFLCEANFQDEDIEASRGNHLSATQAAELAKQAGVKRLVISHLPAFRELGRSREEAARIFEGVEMAEEGMVLEI